MRNCFYHRQDCADTESTNALFPVLFSSVMQRNYTTPCVKGAVNSSFRSSFLSGQYIGRNPLDDRVCRNGDYRLCCNMRIFSSGTSLRRQSGALSLSCPSTAFGGERQVSNVKFHLSHFALVAIETNDSIIYLRVDAEGVVAK